MNTIHVTKSDGSLQVLDHEKINQMVDKVCVGLDNISPSVIALNARIQFFDGIPTSTIQQTLIDSAVGLISDTQPDYTYAAARLFLDKIYKEVYGGVTKPPSLYDHINTMVAMKYYDPMLISSYTTEEIEELNEHLDFSRDTLLSYAAVQQIYSKYLIQDRTTKRRFETPQQMFMVMSMAFHINEPKNRVQHVKDFYDGVSKLDLSMPTPIQAGVRSSMKQYASCALIRSDDSLKSINAAANAATLYGAKRAGLGIDVGGIRAIGNKVGSAGTSHTGIIPFIKKFLTALKSCNQGGIRSSSVTMFYPFWHYEVEEMLVLKNNRGTEETRARHSDYGIKLNALFYKRVRDNTDISLFSPHVSKEMYEAFHSGDNEKFEELYVALEKDPLIRRKVINARELLNLIATERASTGRIYIVNIDHVNNHSSFNENVYQSNLCLIGDTVLKAKVDGVEQTATIEQVTDWFKAGKKVEVLSCNTNSKVDEYKLVSDAAMTGKNKKVIKVTDSETGKFIICTPEHRVWTENRGYVEAKDLQPNDQLKIE